jgi:hypothetical protein
MPLKLKHIKNMLLITDTGYFDRAKIMDFDNQGG